MDPLSIVVSIDALLATAWTLARTTASIISAIKEAPAHIEAVKNDLTDFYSILGQLQGLVNEAESSSNTADGCLKTSTFEVLENSLRNSVTTFKDLKVLINEFNSQDLIKEVGKWKSPRWMFTESRMESLRKDLMSCKATLSTEISVLAW